MKSALPENAKIAKEGKTHCWFRLCEHLLISATAKECLQECVSEFISFITSEGQ